LKKRSYSKKRVRWKTNKTWSRGKQTIIALVLVGPTAVGKTEISLDLAGENCEIVSADSVQVYRYLDIGSCKPGTHERGLVSHHMIDVVNPDFPFTAGEYCRRAAVTCDEIEARGKYPLFVGGTGLYIDSFFQGLADIPEIEESVRENLMDELQERGLLSLFRELMAADREFASRVHENDRQRILRGLEVFRGTGRPISSFYSDKKGHETDGTLYLGLFEDREILKKRIDERVDSMIESGLVEEVEGLRKMGYGPGLKSMRSIGYREINSYLDGVCTLDNCIETIKRETKKYAKRQMTWFRKNSRIHWFRREERESLFCLVQSHLLKYT